MKPGMLHGRVSTATPSYKGHRSEQSATGEGAWCRRQLNTDRCAPLPDQFSVAVDTPLGWRLIYWMVPAKLGTDLGTKLHETGLNQCDSAHQLEHLTALDLRF